MASQSTHHVTLISAASAYLASMFTHAWKALTFSHNGEGLHNLSTRHLTVIASMGLAALWFLPTFARGTPHPSLWLIAIGIGSMVFCRVQFGTAAAAGLSLLMLLTEPVGALLIFGAGSLGKLLSSALGCWSLVASLVYVNQCIHSQKQKN